MSLKPKTKKLHYLDVYMHIIPSQLTPMPYQMRPGWVTGGAALQMNEMNTPDKSWVLITGASSGFGEEFARQYAEQGHSLVLVARRLDWLDDSPRRYARNSGVDVVVERVDLSEVAAVSRLHQQLRERGIAIDILINNAGHGLQGNATLVAPGHSLSCHEWMNHKDLS
jgi:NADP-dependent 3-hydroxy acid dehydrogenase YdfG